MCCDGLTDRQWAFVAGVVATRDIASAADQVGISERTARRWVSRPEVLEAVAVVDARVSCHVWRALYPRVVRAMGELITDLGATL